MSRPLLILLLLLARLPPTELRLPCDCPSSLSLSRDWLLHEVGFGAEVVVSVEWVEVGALDEES